MLSCVALAAVLGPARADVFVPPLNCSTGCALPFVDGVIDPLEYADGRKLPLQDYGIGGANGDLFLAVSQDHLHIGVRVHEGLSAMGSLDVWVDAKRNETLDGVIGADVPRSEDRHFLLRYNLANSSEAVLGQSMGSSGDWVPITGPVTKLSPAWATSFEVSQPPGDPGFIHIEMRILMRTFLGTSEPVASKRVGLGIEHATNDGSWETLPNSWLAPPQGDSTASWETVLFELPPSIPLSLTTYNIGQMPSVYPDGGAGDPEDFAKELWNRDVICLNEVWTSGDRRSVYDSINALRAVWSLPPMDVVGMSWNEDNDTGLMLLSARPILKSRLIEYNNDICSDTDCLANKGAIWARVLLDQLGGNKPVGSADRFVDVYCTHLQANSDQVARLVRSSQMGELKAFIDSTRAPDRPALLMGDFNVIGLTGVDSDEEYFAMRTALGISSLSSFDAMNHWLSDAYDLGMLQSPVNGTNLPDGCGPSIPAELPDNNRYDYILVLPAPAQWPDYGIAKEPVVTVDPMYRPELSSDECLSDHALLAADVRIVETVQPGKWNPRKSHEITYRVARLVDHASGGCCADWYTPFIGINDVYRQYSDDDTPDGDVAHPDWHVSIPLSGVATAYMQVLVYEWDGGSEDDHYDCTVDGLDPKFRFSHGSGLWEELDDSYGPLHLLGSFDDHPGGLVYETFGTPSANYGDVLHVIEAREL